MVGPDLEPSKKFKKDLEIFAVKIYRQSNKYPEFSSFYLRCNEVKYFITPSINTQVE